MPLKPNNTPLNTGPDPEPSPDLTTVAAVRSFLQKPEADTGQDAVIASLITAASRQIARYCERQFIEEGTATKTFEWPGTGLVDFTPYEAQSVATVELDADADSPSTVTAAEYRLWPANAPDETYFALRLNPYNPVGATSERWGRHRLVSVTGVWGMTSVPEDVAQAAIVTVAIWMRRDVAAFTNVWKIDEGYVERPQALPSAVKGALDEWKRRGA